MCSASISSPCHVAAIFFTATPAVRAETASTTAARRATPTVHDSPDTLNKDPACPGGVRGPDRRRSRGGTMAPDGRTTSARGDVTLQSVGHARRAAVDRLPSQVAALLCVHRL